MRHFSSTLAWLGRWLCQHSETLSQACSLQCLRNTRSRSHSSTPSRSGSVDCRETLSQCKNRSKPGREAKSPTVTAKMVIYEAFVEGKFEAPKHLARTVNDSTLSRSTRNSGRGRSGVSPTRSLRPSGTGSLPAIQSDSQAGRVSGDEVLSPSD